MRSTIPHQPYPSQTPDPQLVRAYATMDRAWRSMSAGTFPAAGKHPAAIRRDRRLSQLRRISRAVVIDRLLFHGGSYTLADGLLLQLNPIGSREAWGVLRVRPGLPLGVNKFCQPTAGDLQRARECCRRLLSAAEAS